MNPRTSEKARTCGPRWPGLIPRHLLSRIGVAGCIAAAFWRVVCNPADGLDSIAFWLLLFTAAALNERCDGLPACREST